MTPKKTRAGSKKTTRGTSHDEEWVPSISNEATLNSFVVHDVLLDRATGGWRPAASEPFPMPHTDKLVVFEDYFFCGFGVFVHPFPCGLIDYYGINLCNQSPNSILHVSIFINLCESYLGILRHFDLFFHFFYLKIKGGSGSRVVSDAYLQLWDGMMSEYIAVPFNTNVKAGETIFAVRCGLGPSKQ
jgi:hypothetical protein